MKAKYIAPKIDIMECETDAILYGSIEKKEITINVIPDEGSDAVIEIGEGNPLGGGIIEDAKKGWGSCWDDEDDF